MRRFLTLAAIGLILGLPAATQAPAEAPATDELARRIDAYLQPFEEIGHLSGNLLVARGEEVVYERSFGMANYELGVPNDPETRFNVASVTKSMTKIVLVKLAEQGKLTLQDKLSKWIPDYPRGDEITVEQLARHRAGIPHRVNEDFEQTVPRTAEEMVQFAMRKPLTGEPGDKYVYSSGGYSVLARVLELAGGKSYAELLDELVFQPAGMAHSAHTDSRSLLTGRASCYLPSASGGLENGKLQDLSFLVGAGSVYSTARDLHRLLFKVRSAGFGIGVLGSSVDEEGIDWNGVTNGFRAFADWHKPTDVTVVFTANVQTGAANRIRADVPRIAAGETIDPPTLPRHEPVPVDAGELRTYQGVYELRPGSPLTVRLERGVLRVNDWILVPTGKRTFFSPQDYAVVEVVMSDTGVPERLDWVIDGQPYPCPRTGDL